MRLAKVKKELDDAGLTHRDPAEAALTHDKLRREGRRDDETWHGEEVPIDFMGHDLSTGHPNRLILTGYPELRTRVPGGVDLNLQGMWWEGAPLEGAHLEAADLARSGASPRNEGPCHVHLSLCLSSFAPSTAPRSTSPMRLLVRQCSPRESPDERSLFR